jgi:hypothetical protein
MDLFLRRVIHPQARDNYRVIVKVDGEDKIGSVGIQQGNAATSFWAWGIDTVIPMRDVDSQAEIPDSLCRVHTTIQEEHGLCGWC